MTKRNIQFLEYSEVRMIIDAIKDDDLRDRKDKALLEVLFSSGLRIAEALALKRNQFTSWTPKQGTLELSIVGKGSVQRTVYISPKALKAVHRYLAGRDDDDERLFPETARGVQKMVKIRADWVGIKKFVSPHIFRHSMATYMLQQGVSIFHVQRFLGHKNLSTTAIYLGTSSKELKDIHKKLMR